MAACRKGNNLARRSLCPLDSAVSHTLRTCCNNESYECRGGASWLARRHANPKGFKSRSGQIAYFHGVKTRLSTLETGHLPRGSDARKTVGPDKTWVKQNNDWRGWNRHYQCISGIRLGLLWKLRTLATSS